MANVNLRAKEDGKEKTGEIPPVLSPFHGPLRFFSSHSRFSLAFIRDQTAKNEAPGGRGSGESIRFEFI